MSINLHYFKIRNIIFKKNNLDICCGDDYLQIGRPIKSTESIGEGQIDKCSRCPSKIWQGTEGREVGRLGE